MLGLVSSLVLATSVPSPGAELLQSIRIDVPLTDTVAQMSDEERKVEEKALEEDMAEAREKLGHTPEASPTPAEPEAVEATEPPEAKPSKKERKRRKRERRKKKDRGPEPQLNGKTRGRYMVMGIIDANIALWTLVGAIGATAVSAVFADLDRQREFFGDVITPNTDPQRRIAIGFGVTAGILYALTGIATWRTVANFKNFSTLNKQVREQRKASKKLSLQVTPETWELMGLYAPVASGD